MAPTKTEVPIAATRIDYRSSISFDVAESRLRSSIQKDPEWSFQTKWKEVVRSAFHNASPQAAFTSLVESTVGPHGFMHFFEVDHGAWLPLFSDQLAWKPADGKNLKAKRFILGNPLIAIGMMKCDLNAGLYAPTELFLIEEETGGCRIVYQLPSGLVAGYEGAEGELKKGALTLDEKLEMLVVDVLRD
jgi:hypothetical protein